MGGVGYLLVLFAIALLALRWLIMAGKAPLSQQTIRTLLLQRLLGTLPNAVLVVERAHQIEFRVGERRCAMCLDQLYRRCAEWPFRTPVLIRQAVAAVQRALAAPAALPQEWQERVQAVLLRTDLPTPPHAVTHPAVGMLVMGYVLEANGAFRWITQRDIEEAGLTDTQLRETALRNLERTCNRLVIDAHQWGHDDADRLLRFQTADGADAARLLIPSFFQRFSPRFGERDLLVGVPTRDTLIMISADDAEEAALLAWHTRREYAHGAYPLSPQLIKVTEHGPVVWQTASEPTSVANA